MTQAISKGALDTFGPKGPGVQKYVQEAIKEAIARSDHQWTQRMAQLEQMHAAQLEGLKAQIKELEEKLRKDETKIMAPTAHYSHAPHTFSPRGGGPSPAQPHMEGGPFPFIKAERKVKTKQCMDQK